MTDAESEEGDKTVQKEEQQEGKDQEGEKQSETFYVSITMEGGSGKARIESPVEVTEQDAGFLAKLVWNSENYDYMLVDGVRYENENPGGPSTFTVPVKTLDEPLPVIGDTVAMSQPHEIEYVITWGEKVAGPGASDESGSAPEEESEEGEGAEGGPGADQNAAVCSAAADALKAFGLLGTGSMDHFYAKCFEAQYFGDYTLLTIENSGVYLIVPENGAVPEGLPKEVTVLQKPLDRTYLVSTSAMDLVCACNGLDRIALSGTAEKDWYIEEAKTAMQEGKILYAGKYRAPDYELLLEKGCNLAIENTMIYHQPAVKEKLTELGIPVLVETSSYESHPLGRLEWIRLYGLLFDRQEEAESVFKAQLTEVEPLMQSAPDTGKSVAFFHMTANGMINVRRSGDYITRMIELSGGHYALSGTGESDNALSTMNMQMEDFYAQAQGADILIYNSTIGGEISSVEELLSKNPLFADFKAVREGRVWCCKRSLFQKITGAGDFMKDLNAVLTDTDREYVYLKKLD